MILNMKYKDLPQEIIFVIHDFIYGVPKINKDRIIQQIKHLSIVAKFKSITSLINELQIMFPRYFVSYKHICERDTGPYNAHYRLWYYKQIINLSDDLHDELVSSEE